MSLSRQQLTLLGIFALFIGPVLLVILMRSSWWQYQPAGLKNRGHLVQPPAPLALQTTTAIDRKWLILYALDLPCGVQCIEDVTALRQIHRAAGRNGEHLSIVLLSETQVEVELQSQLLSIYPQFNLLADANETAFATLESVNNALVAGSAAENDIHTYVLDPMHNVILAYGASAAPNDLHKDLKRLLKWSDQEGRQ